MSDQTDQERALAFLWGIKTEAELKLKGIAAEKARLVTCIRWSGHARDHKMVAELKLKEIQEEKTRLMARIQWIVHDIARIWQHNDLQAVDDVLRKMERRR